MIATAIRDETLAARDHVETATDPAAFAHWPDDIHDDMLANTGNGCVGTVLVSETERVRVWHLTLEPGKRCPFHRHVSPYFWTCHSTGLSRGYTSDGEIKELPLTVGQTQHFIYGEGEFMLHSVENIGETTLLFTTVEFLDGPNRPLDVPDRVRLHGQA